MQISWSVPTMAPCRFCQIISHFQAFGISFADFFFLFSPLLFTLCSPLLSLAAHLSPEARRTLSLRNLLARSSRERRMMKMRRRKLRKRRVKLPAPHAPVWAAATCSVPTVPHLAQPPQPLTVAIGPPSSPGSRHLLQALVVVVRAAAAHPGPTTLKSPTVLPVPMGTSTGPGQVRWPQSSASPAWLSPARAVHSSVTLIPINPPGGPVQAPCCAWGGASCAGADEVMQDLVEPVPAGPIPATAGPIHASAGTSQYNHPWYSQTHSAATIPGTAGSSRTTAGCIPVQPAPFAVQHPRYSPGTSRYKPQHPRPGGRPVATATALPGTTATPLPSP
ncbi:vegetative cell wall protein gp1-like [Corvus kubaryi]|uniref:vegetative cell wall protein gp1-like n=1 Tax=Corvus kubaryi TaxID=68294 RepID=UPI001C055244|nr:vegetative cell wall protein gp1-like [Corvus kubaryi]XP_041902262.1 vegetative cell wall protein gp1-like [Corvus kubaryi]